MSGIGVRRWQVVVACAGIWLGLSWLLNLCGVENEGAWVLGVTLLLLSCWVLVCNCHALVTSAFKHQFVSQIPLVGAFFGVVGLLVIPIRLPHPLLYLVPVVLDVGTIMLLLWVVWCTWKKMTSRFGRPKQ